MTPCIGVTVCGKKYYPLLNIEAKFRLQEEFPPDFMDVIANEDTKASFELAVRVFHVLCENGNAVRKHYGYEEGNLPDFEELSLLCEAADIVKLKTYVMMAINKGVGVEIESDEDVDLTLLEYQKKT